MAKQNDDNIIQEKWQDIKTAIRDRWGAEITDEDLDRTNPRRVELCHLLNEKCGLSEREADDYLDKVLLRIQGRQMGL